MDNVVGYNRRGAATNASVGSGGGGGDVDDILKRLGNVEGHVSELRSQVSGIVAVLPHLATKADVADLRTDMKADVAGLRADMKATVGDLKTAIANVKGDLATMETAIIKWIIGTVLTATALAFTIAKFVH